MPSPMPHDPQYGPASLTGPWTPQTVVSADDSTGAVASEAAGDGPTPVMPGYEILGILGRGGMGVVYRARQMPLNRIVALKMILSDRDRADRKELIRFLAEAEAVAAVKHPHVVQVFEYGDSEGRPFLALEYLSGGSLADRLKFRGRLDPKAAAQLVAQLANGVQAIHDRGIVHRDLKPGNVLFDESGEPKISDFGLAKRDDRNDLTARQAIMGTPAYMSPEQATGGTKFVGPAADIYSLGVILYVCLTGTKPFEDDDPIRLLRKVAEEEPERPRRRVPGLSRDIELICLKCLSKSPHERYATAQALADDLARFAADEPVSVRPAGAVERAVKWSRRKPTLAAAYGLTAVSLMLVGLVAGAVWLWQQAEGAKGQLQIAKDVADTAKSEAVIARDAEEIARKNEANERRKAEDLANRMEVFEYGKSMQVAHQEWREGNVATTLGLLEAAPKYLRGWEWNYLHRLCHSELLTLKGHSSIVYSASFNANGTRIVTGSSDKTAKVWDAQTGTEILALTGHADIVFTASFGANGTRIVTGSGDKSVKVWDAQLGTEVRTFMGSKALMSADGSRIVTGIEDQTVKVWDAHSGTEVLTIEGGKGLLSADGSRIVTGNGDLSVKVWDALTGAELLTLKGHTKTVTSASLSKDGSRIVTGSWDTTARMWDAKTGAELLTLKGHTGDVTSVSFVADDSRILTGSRDQTAKVWDSKLGAELLTLRGHTGDINSVSSSADGSRILTGSSDKTAKVWDAQTGAEVLTLKGRTGSVNSASISANRSRILTGSNDKTAKVWDAQTGAELLVLKGHTGNVTSASLSTDGTRIVTGSWDKTAKVWDAQTGAELLVLKGHTGNVTSASLSTDGTRIVTGSWDTTAKVWDAQSGAEVLALKGHTGIVYSASFSTDGKRIVTGSGDKTAKVWDAQTGTEILTLKGHTGGVVTTATFSMDGSQIVTGTSDKSVKVWDAQAGTETLALKGLTGIVYSASFSANGLRIVTGSSDKTAKVWDAKTGAEVLTLKGHDDAVTSASFSIDDSQIITGSWDRTVKVWDAGPPKRESLPTAGSLSTIPAASKSERNKSSLQLADHTSAVLALGFNSDGSRLVTGDSKLSRVWDAKSGKELHKLTAAVPVTRAEFGVDNKQLLTACNSEGVVRLHSAGGRPLGFLHSKEGGLIREALFTRDGKRVVTVHSTGVVSVFEIENLKLVKSIPAFDPKLVQNGLAISPDGKRVCSAVGKGNEWTIKVWDLETSKEIQSWAASKSPVWGVAWSADGKWIVSGGVDQIVKVWHADTGKLHMTLAGATKTVPRVAIHPDNNRIAATCFDGIVRVWDRTSGQIAATFDLGATGIGNVVFSPNGQRLAASAPGVVKIWELSTAHRP
jgi:eukaryotic-like serine/threonine-protein kinase